MKQFIVFLGVLVCLIIAMVILRASTLNQIAEALQKRDFKKFDEVIDTFFAHYFIDKYTRHSLILEAYMLQHKTKDVYDHMHHILKFKLNLSQQQELLGKCFYYFLSENAKEYMKTTLEYISKVKNEAMYKDCELFYDVLVLKKANHLEETLELLAKTDKNEGVLQYLAGLQYHYLKDRENSHKYLELALVTLKNTPYEAAIRHLLKEK